MGGVPRVKLIGVVGSHPCVSVELMLRHKGLEYTRLDLPNITHKALLPLLGYRSTTVPVARIDGRRVVGTRRIARALEALVPDPPILDGPGVEAAESWADGELQDGVRRLSRYGVGKDPEAMASFVHGPLLGVPERWVRRVLPALRPVVALQMHTSEETAHAWLKALPAQLDRVDELLAQGVIGGARPNVADFQIAPCVRLMLCFDQLRDVVDARPAGAYARALVPEYPGRFRDVFPPGWLPR